jgi:hypothetical protein
MVADALTGGVRGLRAAVRWARRQAAEALRQTAELLDALPVAALAEDDDQAEAPDVLPMPIVLPMPSVPAVPMPAAAQVTVEAPAVEAPARGRATDDDRARPDPLDGGAIAWALLQHGSIRAAARALSVPESTLRVQCRKAGVRSPRARR